MSLSRPSGPGCRSGTAVADRAAEPASSHAGGRGGRLCLPATARGLRLRDLMSSAEHGRSSRRATRNACRVGCWSIPERTGSSGARSTSRTASPRPRWPRRPRACRPNWAGRSIRTYSGRASGTEVARALLKSTSTGWVFRRVVANCYVDNVMIWKIMERIGMRREARYVADSLYRDGSWRDSYAYALLAEWRLAEADPVGLSYSASSAGSTAALASRRSRSTGLSSATR